MRALRYIVVIAALVAVLLVVVYQRRDSVAREITNRILAGSDVVVVDVEVDVIGPSRVIFKQIDLRLSDGARVAIEAFEMPVSFPDLEPFYLSIGAIRVAAGSPRQQAGPLSPTVRAFLALPDRLAGTAVTVGLLDYPGMPVVTGIVWNLAGELQRLHADVASMTFAVELRDSGDGAWRGQLEATTATGVPAMSLDAAVTDRDDGLSIEASGTVEAAPWSGLSAIASRLPAAIAGLDGTLYAMTAVALDRDGPGQLAALARVATDSPLVVATSAQDGMRLVGNIPVSSPVEFRMSLPEADWSFDAPDMLWNIDRDGYDKLPLRVSGLGCSHEMHCRLVIDVGPGPLEAGGASAERFSASLPLEVTFGNGVTAEISHEPSLLLSGVRTAALRIGSIGSLGADNARLTLGDGEPRAALDGLSLNLGGIEAGDIGVDALTLRLSDLRATFAATPTLDSNFSAPANSGTATIGGFSARLPALAGKVAFDGGSLRTNAELGSPDGGIEAAVAVDHDVETGRGRLAIDGGRWNFDVVNLADRIGGLPDGFDVVGGTATIAADASWDGGDPETVFALQLSALAARYADIAATGIDGSIEGRLPEAGLQIDRSTLSAALIDAGIEMRDAELSASMEADGAIDVATIGVGLLGGRIAAGPFRYDPHATSNALTLDLRGIQLPFMADLAGFESLEVEGSISGSIPVTIRNRQIIIEDGQLANDPPGGVIRFDAGGAGLAGQPNVALAARALRNFRFDSLTSGVRYLENGDLLLDMRLSGINPDMDPNQPVILNLTLENNVPELLESLQAVRSIEEVLEKRAGVQ